VNGFFLVNPSAGSIRDHFSIALDLARMLRADAARLPRVRAVLIDELARSVVSTDAVQLAVAILRETNTDARLTLALRLCEVLEREAAGPGAMVVVPRDRLTEGSS